MQFYTNYKDFHLCDWIFMVFLTCHRCIQRDLEVSIPVWVLKLGSQKSFLVQYILSSIDSDK